MNDFYQELESNGGVTVSNISMILHRKLKIGTIKHMLNNLQFKRKTPNDRANIKGNSLLVTVVM